MEDHSKLAVEVFDKHATLYQSKFMQLTAYEPELNRFLEQVNDGGNILDIACGPGNIIRYLLDKKPRLNILGTDLSPAMIELAKSNCPEAEFQLLDCRLISKLPKKFNGIVIGFCLPYLNRTEAGNLLEDAAMLLLPGGSVYLSTILGKYEASGYKTASTGDKVFTHYYGENDMDEILSAAGLRPVSSRILAPPPGIEADTELILLAVKPSTGVVYSASTRR